MTADEPARFSYTVEPAPGALVAELRDADGNVTGHAIAPGPDWEDEDDEPGRPFPEGWTDIGATDG